MVGDDERPGHGPREEDVLEELEHDEAGALGRGEGEGHRVEHGARVGGVDGLDAGQDQLDSENCGRFFFFFMASDAVFEMSPGECFFD